MRPIFSNELLPGEKFVEPRGGMIGDPGEHVGKPSLGVEVVELSGGDQGVHGGRALTAAVRPGD
jgi:hypothetical protein